MLFQKRKCSEENSIERLKREPETADAVLIGAGAGLSTSAGFIYTGERFHQNFSDFEAKYGFHDIQNQQERQKLQRHIICPVILFCIRSVRL